MKSPAEQVQIRAMQASDIENVLRIAERSPGAPRWPASAYEAALHPENRPFRIALVAVGLGADVVEGFLVASVIPPEATLETIVVEPGRRRQGLGGRLLQTMAESLRAKGVTELLLEVRASNRAAIGLYETQGFAQVGKRRRYYADPEEDAILMSFNSSS